MQPIINIFCMNVSYLNFSVFALCEEFSSYFICLRENINTYSNYSLITAMKNSCLRLQIYVLFTRFAIYWEISVAILLFEIIWVFREWEREHEGKLIIHLVLHIFNAELLVYAICL